MKRITVIPPSGSTRVLPKQPFHRTLLLVSLCGVYGASINATAVVTIADVSGNIIWKGQRTYDNSPVNVIFSVLGCETTPDSSLGPPNSTWGAPLPANLTIPANFTLTVNILDWDGYGTMPDLVLTTDDPFLDGARPFDDLQAP